MAQAPFQGVVGRDWRESTPWWPEPVRAPEGAPNVVIVVLDDVGFAQLGCYGSDIETPNFDRLAAGGLRFTGFHTTALCSPTRACLLTGRNHHSVGMGRITELAAGYPGYTGNIPKSAGFLPEMLGPQGWAAYALGKWHLTPEVETGAGAPRTRWPLGRGFERYYGYFSGETHQFAPALVHDNHPIDPPGRVEDGYHLTEDLAGRAIEWIGDLRASAPDRPFFMWFATGCGHSPHQAPTEWIEHYRGRYDDGWDAWRERALARQHELGVVASDIELTPRPDWVPAWDSLSDDERRVAARFMECFAGFLSHTDAQIGRVVDFLTEIGELDDTVIVVVSDNGASSEGGPQGSINDLRHWNGVHHSTADALAVIDELGGPRHHNNYPWGWTMAGNTPLRRWKREVHEGGVADPMIVHWPARVTDAGAFRRQFVHAIDVAPTILELLGITPPDEIDGVPQQPIEGTSFAYLLDATDADADERHHTQYFEMLGSRALYHRGWKAVTYKPLGRMYGQGDPDLPFDDDTWELYHVAVDPTEAVDLADAEPAKLREMVERWWGEASKYKVLPLDNRTMVAFMAEKPQIYRPRSRFVYYAGGARVPEAVAVNVRNRSHIVTAEVTIPDGGAEGVLIAQGSVLGGWTFYVQDDRLHYVHNLCASETHRVDASEPIGPGRHALAFEFDKSGEYRGTGRLRVDGLLVGQGEIPRFTPVKWTMTGAGLHCGRDPMIAVSDDYASPFTFTGTLHRVTVDVSGVPYHDLAAELGLAMAEQ